MWHDPEHEPTYSQTVELDWPRWHPSSPGPSAPGRIPLAVAPHAVGSLLAGTRNRSPRRPGWTRQAPSRSRQRPHRHRPRPSGPPAVTEPPQAFTTTVRIDTPAEAGYYRHGGVLQYLLRQLLEQ